jgi:hypothetical protein
MHIHSSSFPTSSYKTIVDFWVFICHLKGWQVCIIAETQFGSVTEAKTVSGKTRIRATISLIPVNAFRPNGEGYPDPKGKARPSGQKNDGRLGVGESMDLYDLGAFPSNSGHLPESLAIALSLAHGYRSPLPHQRHPRALLKLPELEADGGRKAQYQHS